MKKQTNKNKETRENMGNIKKGEKNPNNEIQTAKKSGHETSP